MTLYDGDSFFTLGFAGRAGLIALSVFLSVVTIRASRRIGRRRRIITRILIALAALYLFTWLSPQIYYAYYLMIFDGLPLQIVIQPPPSPGDVARLLTFQLNATLSDHGKGALGWLLIAASLIPPHLTSMCPKISP